MSRMVNELLQFSDDTLEGEIEIDVIDSIQHNEDMDIQEKMIQSAKEVRSSLKDKKIVPTDALNLWCATMQACAASLIDKMKFTVVMSARIM